MLAAGCWLKPYEERKSELKDERIGTTTVGWREQSNRDTLKYKWTGLNHRPISVRQTSVWDMTFSYF